ncbi:MAG: S41 family peptidase [Bacillota bacterium]|nr:S41 family peptidase [Bacillota bacterium]
MNKKVLSLIIIVSILIGAGGMIICTTAGVGGSALLTSEDAKAYNDTLKRYSKLEQLLETIETQYYKEVDEEVLLEGAYKGLFEALDDPYSEYVSASNAESYMEDMSLEFGGIGMAFMMDEDGLALVDSVYLDSPADKAGLKAGDKITKVDGEDVLGLTADEVKTRVRGEVNSKVEITYKRDEKETTVTITREIITEQTVASALLNKETVGEDTGLGYIQIAAFGSGTADDFKKELKKMEDANVKGLVIDLRNNGGGLVDTAIDIADMLMNKGTVVYAQAQDGTRHYYNTYDGRTDLPYVLLVNEYSASATEILATGVQSNKEGQVIGKTTYGKGIIQSAAELEDGSAIKMTIWQYFSPSGDPIHKVGVTPDIVVELEGVNENGEVVDSQLLKAIEVLK